MIVVLTGAEMLLAYHVAAMRRVQNIKKNIQPRYGAPNEEGSEELDILSCRGEMAVAKALNLYWAGEVGNYKAKDVGGIVEVRSRRKEWHQLILHESDDDKAPFVLAHVGSSATVNLIGWCWAYEGKTAKYWKDPAGGRPAFFVPKEVLRPITELVQNIEHLRRDKDVRAYEAA